MKKKPERNVPGSKNILLLCRRGFIKIATHHGMHFFGIISLCPFCF